MPQLMEIRAKLLKPK